MSRAFSEALTTSANGQPINLSSILELAPEQLLSVKGQVVSISSINIVQTYYGGKQDLMIRDKRPYCMCQGSAVGQVCRNRWSKQNLLVYKPQNKSVQVWAVPEYPTVRTLRRNRRHAIQHSHSSGPIWARCQYHTYGQRQHYRNTQSFQVPLLLVMQKM